MDGNLLDPDNATLAKEWNLPELPAEKSSSLPGSSRELAEIFGTSDDEDNMEFPFCLNVDKTFPDLNLADERVSEFFLKSINSLNVPVSMDSLVPGSDVAGVKPIPKAVGGNEIKVKGSVKPVMEGVNTIPKDDGVNAAMKEGGTVPGAEGVKETTGSCDMDTTSAEENSESAESEELKSETEEQELTRMTLRSTRLNRISSSSDGPVVKKKVAEAKGDVDKEAVKKEEEGEGGKKPEQGEDKGARQSDGVKESVASSDEGDEGDETPKATAAEEKEKEVKEEVATADSSDVEEEGESDDPDRLWCICHQPHDDRFMICCDQCEEWYHGSCVGISVSQGKRMEREGQEYTCPICVEKERQSREQRELSRTARIGRRDVVKEKDLKILEPVTSTGASRRRSSSGAGFAEDADQYGLSQLFQPDNVPRGGMEAEESSVKTKFKAEYTGSCINPGCKKPTVAPSVYCGIACVEKHASDSLKMLSDSGVSFQSNPSEFVRGSGGVSVIEKATGKMLVGFAAPSEKNLVPWLKEHPSFEILLHKKRAGSSKKPKAKPSVRKEKKEPDTSSKFPKIALMDPTSVRANAKRALYQIIWKRCEEAADMKNLEQSNVEAIANDVEEKLFNINQDINPKYKNKYRSLVFNLKDTKNQGLFRKVVTSEVSPWELVRMSTEKLASEELAQWREKTIKKNLDMIKVREEEAGTAGKVIRKFTYKGEVEIDTADDSKIDPLESTREDLADANADGSSSSSVKLESGSKSKEEIGSKSKNESGPKHKKPRSDSKSSAGGILSLLDDVAGSSLSSSGETNTTSQHGSHVYDQHCDICAGSKVNSPPPPPPPDPPSMTPPKDFSPLQLSPEAESMDTEPASEHPPTPPTPPPVLSGNDVVWKGFVNMSGLAKFATTAYPVSGPAENVHELLPDTLHVMGRIAHVQVWDYMDKLRSSTTRDIVVLRFWCVEEEMDSYNSMLTYLVKKHRCGVINCCFPGMKDMYLVPLQASAPVASQLLPFKGPGLPDERQDMLLGLIVRSKGQKSRLDQSQSPVHVQKITAEVCIKRQHSVSTDDSDEHFSGPPTKRSRMVIEVGVRGETPPRIGGFQDGDYLDSTTTPDGTGLEKSGWLSSDSGGGSKTKVEGVKKEFPLSTTENIQMSFYGEHRPLQEPDPAPQSKTTLPKSSKPALPGENLSSIISQLSDEKMLKDLVSAVSSLTSKSTPPSITPHSRLGSSASNTILPPPPPPPPPPPHPDHPDVVPNYGANTPPPDDVLQVERKSHYLLPPQGKLPRVAGGPPFPRVAGGPPFPEPVVPQHTTPPQAPPPQGLPQQDANRERFANTPPPEYQGSFTYHNDSGHPYHAPQQPPLRDPRYANSSYQQAPPPPPQQQRGGNYSQDWEFNRQERPHRDPRLRDQDRGRGSSDRGYSREGGHSSYRDHHKRGHEQHSYQENDDRKYPSEWYRD